MAETNPYESLSGEVTPEQLQSLIQTEADKFAQVRVAQLENKFKQKAVAEDFISDLESTGEQIQKDFGDSPETAKKVDELLADLNNKLNVDEKGNLRPRQKTSDLYKQIKSALQAERLTGQEQSTTKMAENIANAAIAPSNRQPQDSSLEDLQAEMVKNPARVAKILEERLPISED